MIMAPTILIAVGALTAVVSSIAGLLIEWIERQRSEKNTKNEAEVVIKTDGNSRTITLTVDQANRFGELLDAVNKQTTLESGGRSPSVERVR
jgi:hypothetical protein